MKNTDDINENNEGSSDKDTNRKNDVTFKEHKWKSEHETILVEWADKAMCYRWLHGTAHQAYSSTHAWYTIPVIIMSTLTGTANFAQDRFPEDIRPMAQMGIGAVNIFAGILTTIAQFLKISELNEAHRVSSISWDKLYRNIKVELAKSRKERMHVGHMLKMYKEEYDRLMETSPSINEKTITLFKEKFPARKIPENEKDDESIHPHIKRPEICDELVSTAEILFPTIENDDKIGEPSLMEVVRQKHKIMAGYEKEVRDWTTKFENKHGRKPLDYELVDNLKNTMNPDILNKIIKNLLEEFDKNDKEPNINDASCNV